MDGYCCGSTTRPGWACALAGLGLSALLAVVACNRVPPAVEASHPGSDTAAAQAVSATPNAQASAAASATASAAAVGFDRNDYPGDDAMAALHRSFAFTGYWITNPPGEAANSWVGKRSLLRQQGWGFLVLADGRLDAEILKAQRAGRTAAALAQADAAQAVAAAQQEGFPPRTILFLDQEEGGRLLDEQAAYLLGWTQAIAATGFRAGVYASGQPVPDGPGKHITTIEDVRTRVQQGHLHPIAIFDAQDTCPPAPGCTLHPKPLTASGLDDLSAGGNLVAWQYAQSPRRPELTQSCKATYAAPSGNADNCFAPGFPTVFLDMDTAATPDPSQGR